MPLLLTLLSVLGVGLLAATHDPRFNFDEANTLKISNLSWSGIDDVLANEQNFTLYYKTLHVLFSWFGPSYKVAVFFNYIAWLASLFVFGKVAATLFRERFWQLFSVALFALSSAHYYYAYYVRMYGLINLVFLVCTLALLKYLQTTSLRYLGVLTAGLVLLALLHPSGAIIALLFTAMVPFVVRNKKHMAFLFLGVAVCCIVVFLQVYVKPDLRRVYFGSGIDYLVSLKRPFFSYPSRLVFALDSPNGWFFYIVSAFLIYSFLLTVPALGKASVVILVPVAMSVVAHLVPEAAGNPRHLNFLNPPFVMALSIGTYHLAKGRGKATLWPAAVLLCFVAQSLTFSVEEARSAHAVEAGCEVMKGLERGVIITDYVTYNKFENCISADTFRVLFFGPEGVEDVSRRERKEVLELQARMGGSATMSMGLAKYRRKLAKLNEAERQKLAEAVEEAARDEKNVYFVTSPAREYLLPEEIDLINVFPFKKMVGPGVFWFRKGDE